MGLRDMFRKVSPPAEQSAEALSETYEAKIVRLKSMVGKRVKFTTTGQSQDGRFGSGYSFKPTVLKYVEPVPHNPKAYEANFEGIGSFDINNITDVHEA